MSKIYRTSDRIPVKIEDVVLTIAPLSQAQKLEIQSLMLKGRALGEIETATKGILQSIRYAIKDIKGVEDINGNAYKLEFEGDVLTEKCAEELLNLEISGKVVMVCSALANGMTTTFTDEKNVPLVGVEVLNQDGTEKKK